MDSLWLRLLPAGLRGHLAGHATRQTLIQNAGWLVADKLVRLGAGLIIGVWVARYLGPDRFGALNYALAVVMLISALATMGLPDIIVRDFVRHPEQARRIAATATLLRLGGGLASLLIAMATISIARPGETDLLALAVIMGVSLLPQAYDVVDQRMQAHNNVRPAVLIRNSAFVAMAAAKVVAILMGASVTAFAWLLTAEFALVGLGLLLYARRADLAFSLFDARWDEARRLMQAAWPLLLRLLAIGVYTRIDQVLLGRMLGDEAVGIYTAALRISEVWYFIPLAIMTAFVPKLAAEHARSIPDYEARLCTVMRAIIAISVLAALTLSLGSGLIIGLLYGPAFAAAAPVLAIHAWSGLFVGIGVASGAWFVNNDYARFGLYQALAGAIVSILVNLILIPRLGVIGAAWAAVASQAVATMFFNLVAAKGRHMFRLQMRAIGLRL